MNSYNLFKKVYLDLIMQSTIKDDYIDYFFKKENIKDEYKKDPKQLERVKTFIDNIFSELNLNNPNDSFRAKKQKALLYWLRNGTITIPIKEEQKQILQKAFNLLEKHASLNFQNFNSPIDMLNSSDKSVQKINAKYMFNPDNEPAFFNKKYLGDGIVVYRVNDNKSGMFAVRKAIDSDWGYNSNPWCLAARKNGSLNGAWELWNNYNEIPKRIAFKNGKLHAFSATDIPRTCQWWDRNDESSESIPQTAVSDDLEFLIQFCPLTYVENNPNSPPDVLKKLSKHDQKSVRMYIAINPNCPEDILEKLSKDEDKNIRMQVVKNPNCPLDVLKKFSEDDNQYVRKAVTENPNCPPDILRKLSEHDDYNVRRQVARKSNCPEDILRKLSEDEDYKVRRNVAENPNCSLDILEKLSEDDDQFVRRFVAENPNCPEDILRKLSEDEDKFVRRYVAENPNCPLDILRKLSEDSSIITSVAENPNCPDDILRKLSKDEKLFIITLVAKNPNCPIDILRKLSEDKDYCVREGVARNPNCPEDILRKLSEDKDYCVREYVAKNPNCPEDILRKLSENKDILVRHKVAENPNCPRDILEKLANPETEKYESVRSQAKETLQLKSRL